MSGSSPTWLPGPAAAGDPATTTGTISEQPSAWHAASTAEALERLDTSPEGLPVAEADRRLAIHGPNELVDQGSKRPVTILWEQLTAVMVLILLAAAALSLALGKLLEAGAIAAIVVLFALLGFIQEYRAEKAIAALRRMAVPTVRARRGGTLAEVAANRLVPGDVVVLEAGNVVPADLRLIDVASLRVQESALTGESEPVEKRAERVADPDTPLGDRVDMAFLGTQVTYGRGVGVVVATGMATELGRIATLLQRVEAEMTPLQQRLDRVGKALALLGVAVAGLVVGLGALAGESLSDLVLTAISVAVAVIPEGLPAVVTFTLAVGAQRMLRREALIRKLPAVETLGSVTVICTDKTGTLTENRMTVTQLYVNAQALPLDAGDLGSAGAAAAAVELLLGGGSLCNDGEIRTGAAGELELIGDPTETAIVAAAGHVGVDVATLRAELPRVGEVPFDSTRKRMTTLHEVRATDPPVVSAVIGALAGARPGARVAFVKGAFDGLVERASSIWRDGRPEPLGQRARDELAGANRDLASRGMRVLAVAYRTVVTDGAALDERIEDDLVLVGLIGMIDPPRPEVRDAVTTCRDAGVRAVMITGDHPLTASAIARELGIAADGRAVTGGEVEAASEEELERLSRDVNVYARVSPEHKLRIVDALRRQSQVVAMTGDGVNDAPALRRADIGVAMGITGTDVSKEASDMVLRDDNFATIVAAVEEGRVIYDNLRRFISFAVAGNVGKILVMVLWPLPFLFAGVTPENAVALLPLQLLWLNLLTDGLLGLAMGVEPAEPGVMRRAPHSPRTGIFSGGLGTRTAWVGTLIGVLTLALGYWYHEAGYDQWQSMMFAALAVLQVFQALASRSSDAGLRSNPLLVAIIGIVVALQGLAIYGPLSALLDTEPLSAADVAACLACGLVLFSAMKLHEALVRRRKVAASLTASAAPVVR